ncbi:sodium-independent anion transporter [Candidatus Woesearchaeota archaeon CG10_big_fil_rev_8_21_14_0_10_32_9]|nr:MAG: sodium-independent anion transporter [Candidatus Woesearchaeota archaeon CG10_big_fil_rev_8_21_14_0_10_32_9]
MVKNKISNYFKQNFVYDLKAGLITGVVALPLAIAFAIASGVNPVLGVYTAIIAGILGSSLGGSKFSITGPTGAMTVIVLSTVNKYGLEGLMLAGVLAGIIQITLGLIKLGKLVKFIPLPIVSGFTAGIGAIIFIGQIPNFLGLIIPAQEHIWETLIEIIKNFNSTNIYALAISLITLLILIFLPKHLSKNKYSKIIPPSIIALLLATLLTIYFQLNLPKVGDIPAALPSFNLIVISFDLVKNVLPAAFTIALLGAIESLLCAVVCDGMTNTKHKSNKELIGQGITNTILPFFGGIPATAAIARSAVNIREGAKTKIAGIIHSLFLLIIMLFLGGVAQQIPKAFLAGILMFVSFKMINIKEFKTIMRISKQETVVLFITFALTILTDLVFAVQVGMMLAVFLLFIRLSGLTEIHNLEEHDPKQELEKLYKGEAKLKEIVSIYTMNGPFFFGALNIFDNKLEEHIHIKKKYIILRMKHVPFIDTSAIERLITFIKDRNKHESKVYLTTLSQETKKTLFSNKEFLELIAENNIFDTTEEAIQHINTHIKNTTTKKQD